MKLYMNLTVINYSFKVLKIQKRRTVYGTRNNGRAMNGQARTVSIPSLTIGLVRGRPLSHVLCPEHFSTRVGKSKLMHPLRNS